MDTSHVSLTRTNVAIIGSVTNWATSICAQVKKGQFSLISSGIRHICAQVSGVESFMTPSSDVKRDNPSIHPEWQPEYFEDVIIVNGKAWPWMKVQRRKYRFQIINTSNARYFRLSFSNELYFVHVGSDSAYLNKPEKTNYVFLAPSEIADVIVDFTQSISDTVVLTNDAAYPYPSGNPVNKLKSKVIKFIVERKYGDQLKLPTKLFDYPSPDLSSVSHTRYIMLYEYDSDSGNPTHLYLNFVSLDAPVTETPEVGSTELWYVINLTPDNHPFHIHLALFTVLDQTELVNQTEFTGCMLELKNAIQCDITKHAVGQSVKVPAEEKGWKNSFKMRPGFVTKVLMRFSYIHTNASYPFDATAGPGYVYHCHVHGLVCVIMGLIFMGQMGYWAEADGLFNSSKLEMFVDELPDIPKVLGYNVGPHGKPRPKSFTIGMFYKKWKFHRDLPATPVFAYGTSKKTASIPGPRIEVLHGVDSYITWENHLLAHHILPWDPTLPVATPADHKGVPTVVHVHGGIDESASDGFLEAWFTAGWKETGPKWSQRTYRYTNNQQPGNLWYHDHAMGLTRANILAGLSGAYIIRQPDVEDPLGLPRGDQFDRVLFLHDKEFYANGYIFMNRTAIYYQNKEGIVNCDETKILIRLVTKSALDVVISSTTYTNTYMFDRGHSLINVGDNPSIHPEWQPEYFGDVIIVNGKAWPFLKVHRRKYRFRIINASNARYFRLNFTNGLGFVHVGSDSAYLNKPVKTNHVFLGASEIADVVVDFAESSSDTVILENSAAYPYPSGSAPNELNSKVMKFIVEPKYGDNPPLPTKLLDYPSPDLFRVALTRYITLDEDDSSTGNPTNLYINFVPFESPVTETPKPGSKEIWYVINLTKDNHPLHIHLALFTVLDQIELVNLTEFTNCMVKLKNATQCDLAKHAVGKSVEIPAEEQGWKNVFKMKPGFVTKIFVTYTYIHTNASYPFDATAGPGYIYHCHILDHEDNVMARPLKLIA
ncbi:hypothetical protein Droror1_Dr00022470 [Drosera rotundifolia]